MGHASSYGVNNLKSLGQLVHGNNSKSNEYPSRSASTTIVVVSSKMNRLKHILGVNVPRHVPSRECRPNNNNVTSVASPGTSFLARNLYPRDVAFPFFPSFFVHIQRISEAERIGSIDREVREARKHACIANIPTHFPPHDSLSSAAAKRYHGIRTAVNHSGQFRQGGPRLVSRGNKMIHRQCGKTKFSVMSLKKPSLESVARGARRNSTCRFNGRFNGEHGSGKRSRVLQTTVNEASRNSSFVAAVKNSPRSYAQMIADYSEAIRKASVAAMRSDNPHSFSNAIRRSPFSTTSPSWHKRMINIASSEGRENDASHPPDQLGLATRQHNTSVRRRDPRPHHEAIYEDRVTTADWRSDDRSYVKLVADCSRSVRNIVSAASNSALTPRLRASSSKGSLEPFTAPTRNVSSANDSQRTARRTSRPVVETFARQSSTQVSTSASKQPQVELHMVPSAKESVVSINVDSARLSNLTSEELSVVVRSNQKASDPQPAGEDFRWNAATIRQGGASSSASRRVGDFGPMRISISEESAPIKQIEFSINGKPVSELKSIVARTERLDVVTSSDKIEIRLPFAKDDARGFRAVDDARGKTDIGVEQVLNVQISASFQNEPVKGSAERARNVTTSTPSASQAPATRSLKSRPAKDASAVVDDAPSRADVEPDDTMREREIPSRRTRDQREAAWKLPIDTPATDVSSAKRANDAETGGLSADKINVQYSEANRHGDKSEPSDPRVQSNMIPWWSSSDGFNKIKKKRIDREPSRSNWTKKKWPRTSRKVAQTMNDAGTNDPSDTTSRWDSREEQRRGGELKPTVHSSIRPKANQDNPEGTRHDSKIDDTQTPKKMSRVDRTETPSFAPETTKVKSEYNAGEKLDTEKPFVLAKKSKAPKDRQDSALKPSREERSSYPLKEMSLINDAFNTKMRHILDVIKPTEKKKDGTLIDYGLKVPSRKSTIKLSSKAKGTRDPSVMKAQDLIGKEPEAAPNTMQMSQSAVMRAAESDVAEKTEAKGMISKEKDPIAKVLATTVNIEVWDESRVKSMEEEFERDEPRGWLSISAPKIAEIQEAEKLYGLRSSVSSDTRHPLERPTEKKMTQGEKLVSATKASLQTKSTRTKDHIPPKDPTDETPGEPTFTDRPADKLAETTDARTAADEVARRTFASGDVSSKNRRENPSAKSIPDRKDTAGPRDPPKKPSGSSGFKSSADSDKHVRPEVRFSESHFGNKNQPNVVGSVAPWTRVDRPEKSVLYSAWLQRFRHDVDDHGRHF